MQRWWMAAAVVAAACEPSQTSSILDLTGDATAGGEVYASVCATCHGVNGEGVEGLGKALAGTTLTDDEIVATVLTGNDLGMASAADYLLTDQDVADVLAYIRGGLGQ